MALIKRWLGIENLENRLEEIETEKLALEEKNKELEGKKEALYTDIQKLTDELESLKKSPKEVANEKGEPWVEVIDTTFEDPKNPGAGYFELDWNQHFVKMLIEAGYSGRTDEEVVDMWFNDICHGVVNGEIE